MDIGIQLFSKTRDDLALDHPEIHSMKRACRKKLVDFQTLSQQQFLWQQSPEAT